MRWAYDEGLMTGTHESGERQQPPERERTVQNEYYKTYKSRAIKCQFWNDTLAAKKLEFRHDN